jgi:hypothetical protein
MGAAYNYSKFLLTLEEGEGASAVEALIIAREHNL